MSIPLLSSVSPALPRLPICLAAELSLFALLLCSVTCFGDLFLCALLLGCSDGDRFLAVWTVAGTDEELLSCSVIPSASFLLCFTRLVLSVAAELIFLAMDGLLLSLVSPSPHGCHVCGGRCDLSSSGRPRMMYRLYRLPFVLLSGTFCVVSFTVGLWQPSFIGGLALLIRTAAETRPVSPSTV